MQPEDKAVEPQTSQSSMSIEPADPRIAPAQPQPATAGPSIAQGRHFQNDGLDAIAPDASQNILQPTPRVEPLASFANHPYVIAGKTYSPERERKPWRQRGIASWYGKTFHGRRTATGEKYDMFSFSGAHPTLPLPSFVRVTHVENRRSIIVRINDRGPFRAQRVIDLSYAAAAQLGFAMKGTALVEIEAILPDRAQLQTVGQAR